jgi:hypothetical protein
MTAPVITNAGALSLFLPADWPPTLRWPLGATEVPAAELWQLAEGRRELPSPSNQAAAALMLALWNGTWAAVNVGPLLSLPPVTLARVGRCLVARAEGGQARRMGPRRAGPWW